MRDGYTRKREAPQGRTPAERFLSLFRVTLVVASGPAAGSEHAIEREATTLGRGPGADLVFPDEHMSRVHCALEVASSGLRVRDLGSLNKLVVNGAETQLAELKHGDRFRAGDHEFRVLLEERESGPPTYELPEDE
jgi:pSer/pThr/pTyr-binding forkhead associated (FHA) protein